MFLSVGILMGLLTFFCWGIADFLAAQMSRSIGNVRTYFGVQLTSVSIATIYFLLTGPTISLNTTQIIQIIAVAFLQAFAYLSFYKGLEKGNVSIVSPVAGSWIIITVVLGIILNKENPSAIAYVAMALIISGILLISTNTKELNKAFKNFKTTGIHYGLGAMIGWGLSLFLLASLSSTTSLGWFLPTYLFRICTLLIIIVYASISKEKLAPIFNTPTLLKLIPIGLLDITAVFAYSIGVSGNLITIVAPVAAGFPLITVALALIIFKEKLVLNQKIGFIAIILGLILMSIR